ncbi:MAG: hypothetical protein ACYCSR_11760 [Thiomonas sp.]|uniref:Uncharacterized protein n=1 Tax=mine drainage metagenome TaxID=410659 RepID=E6PM90_9ZZZZ
MYSTLLHYAEPHLVPLDMPEMLAEADEAMENKVFYMNLNRTAVDTMASFHQSIHAGDTSR